MTTGTGHALEVREVGFSYAPGKEVLGGVSHRFEPGRVTAVVGPNGAGKSTLLKIMAGVLKPGRGRVMVGESDVSAMSGKQRARRLVYVPQRSSVAFAFSVRQVVAMGRYAADEGESDEAVRRALEDVDLAGAGDAPIGTLSVGQQQRVTLARALAQVGVGGAGDGKGGAAALLADEPVSALDPAHALATMRILRTLAERGLAVVVVLHDLGLVLRHADEAVLLGAAGTIAGAGPSKEALTMDRLGEVFGTGFVELVDSTGMVAGLAPKWRE